MECSSKELKGVEEVFETAINTAVGEELALREQSHSSGSSRKKRRACKIF